MRRLLALVILAIGCEMAPLDPVDECEDVALGCLGVVDGGGESLDYLRGEFCGCLGQGCLTVIRDARKDGEVDEEIEQIMDVARCLRHRK
jgi:hypothetical protein